MAPRANPVFRASAGKSRPQEAMLLRRPDRRRFLCDLCGVACYICSWCDRGHRYCSTSCREGARRRSLLEAGQRYQQTRRGRLCHARRQAAYRRRQQQKVTHHGCPQSERSASVSACAITYEPLRSPRREPPTVRPPSPRRPQDPVCMLCGWPCAPWIRHGFLPGRRPRSCVGGAYDSAMETC